MILLAPVFKEECMAAPRKIIGGTLDGSAHQLAFRIAQSLEETLVSRAVEIASVACSESDELIVTAEHIRLALNADLLGETCVKLGVFSDGKTKTRLPKRQAG
jgi:hypothetical protein